MEVSRLVTLSYIGVALVAFVIFDKTMDWIEVSVDAFNQMALIGTAFTLTNLLALLCTVILIIWMKRHPQVDPFITETVVELRKVTWPGLKDTQRSTVIVIVFSLVLSFSLWFMDQIWERVTDYILTFGL